MASQAAIDGAEIAQDRERVYGVSSAEPTPECSGCEHFYHQYSYAGLCLHPVSFTSPYRDVFVHKTAFECREVGGHCGPEGSHFEKRKWLNSFTIFLAVALSMFAARIAWGLWY